MNTYYYKQYKHHNSYFYCIVKADSVEEAATFIKEYCKEDYVVDLNNFTLIPDNSVFFTTIRSKEDYIKEGY